MVDQNRDDRLTPILRRFEDSFPIVHLRSHPAVSKSRNLGLSHTVADVVGFPDDDCWYEPDLISRVRDLFSVHAEWDGLVGGVVDEAGHTSAGRSDSSPGLLSVLNLWKRVAAASLFVRRRLVDVTGGFDEALGPGAGTPWQAAEDLDYVARAIRAGCSIYYDPALEIKHPPRRELSSQPDATQGYAYGAGVGRALRKNDLPRWFASYYIARSYGAASFSLLTGRRRHARFYWEVGRGRMRGWRSQVSEP